jgi:FAD-dependent urate hydroxylase
MSRDLEVAVVGAGPYGLSCAAFLRNAGVDIGIFGETMGFWHRQMPQGMLLRSRRRSSHIADPHRALTIDAYEATEGKNLGEPIRVEDFEEYGRWYQRRAVPHVDERMVATIDRSDGGFELALGDGEVVRAQRVVIAAGLAPFPWTPPPLGDLPPGLVSHSSEHRDFGRFEGKSVVVAGCGQSALESAALLHESGADVEIVARASGVVWLPQGNAGLRTRLREMIKPPTDVGGRVTGWIAAAPDVFRRMPARLRPTVSRRCLVPAGAGWLPARLERVPIELERRIEGAEAMNGRVRVTLDDGTERVVDHALLATGFRVDVNRYEFLSAELVRDIATAQGEPLLGAGLESSVASLHFVGAPARLSFGPIMRFVVGTWYAAPVIARSALGKRQRLIRFSYKPRVPLSSRGH